MKNAIIVFVKNPVLGKVKTRLADSIGDEAALKVYKHLLAYTRSVIDQIDANIFIFHSDFISKAEEWKKYKNELQVEGDLGLRMEKAIGLVLDEGYDNIVLIGSDCIEITNQHIETAFGYLSSYTSVIGPAVDGGYYLIGMREKAPFLFKDMPWSSEDLFEKTIEKLKINKTKYITLPELSDIDYLKDLEGKINWRNL